MTYDVIPTYNWLLRYISDGVWISAILVYFPLQLVDMIQVTTSLNKEVVWILYVRYIDHLRDDWNDENTFKTNGNCFI